MFNNSTKNSFLKADKREDFYSKIIHKSNIPLLVSPLLLRRRGCGQIDIATIKNEKKDIIIYEIKSTQFISIKQRSRLIKTGAFLASIFKANIQLELL